LTNRIIGIVTIDCSAAAVLSENSVVIRVCTNRTSVSVHVSVTIVINAIAKFGGSGKDQRIIVITIVAGDKIENVRSETITVVVPTYADTADIGDPAFEDCHSPGVFRLARDAHSQGIGASGNIA